MEKSRFLVDKLSQYELMTNMIPGTVLCWLLDEWVGYHLLPVNGWLCVVVVYFVGLVNGRVGSVIIEPFLKCTGIVTFAPYHQFVEAEKRDAKVTLLSQVNNMYRAFLSVFFVVLAAWLLKSIELKWAIEEDVRNFILAVMLLVLFLLSYRKQTSFVKKRIESNMNHQ